MHNIDWIILAGTLLFIVGYGVWKTRKVSTSSSFLHGDNDMSWWMIGLSIMATQASAITFLSTPGQAYEEGMGFVQFYFGLPLAMVILSIFFLPAYYKLNVYTAYEFLEQRFDVNTRTLTSILFLIQRGLAAGLTIFAPAIILSTILDWNLTYTNIAIGVLVIIYTFAGGTKAVSQTQKQQMVIILVGMVAAFFFLLQEMPDGIGFSEAMNVAGSGGRLDIISTDWDLSNKYNIWTGMLGGTFLFLSYFGTDQSQVQRYLTGKSLSEGRLGLMFNGLAKIPMQFFILLTGVLVFVFFQFQQAPLHFNVANESVVKNSSYSQEYQEVQEEYNQLFQQKRAVAMDISENPTPANADTYKDLLQQEKEIRIKADGVISKSLSEKYGLESSDEDAKIEDTDYVFITYVLNYFPMGLIGLLLAVIFSAAMSSTASEINALTTTSMVDIYKRHIAKDISESHYYRASKTMTIVWGLIALGFALIANLFDNLIEAVNIIGSLFYGTILGVFMVAFFIKFVRGRAVFIAAIISELLILYIYFSESLDIAYLWLNAIGCGFVVVISIALQTFLPKKK